jgi:hypothetical protein
VQRHGLARNPFALLPGAAVASTGTASSSSASKTSTSATSGTSTSGSGSRSGSGSSKGESVAPTPSKPSRPSKQQVVIRYTVAAQFGVVPATPEGSPPTSAQLKSYANLKLHEPLPAKNPQLVYLGVVLKTGKDAVFGLTGEAILHGPGVCVPSTTHCQAVELAPGQAETVEAFDPGGNPVIYELKLLSITKTVTTASAARAHVASRPSKRVRALLRRAGLPALAGLRYSGPDLLVAVVARPHRAGHPRLGR